MPESRRAGGRARSASHPGGAGCGTRARAATRRTAACSCDCQRPHELLEPLHAPLGRMLAQHAVARGRGESLTFGAVVLVQEAQDVLARIGDQDLLALAEDAVEALP